MTPRETGFGRSPSYVGIDVGGSGLRVQLQGPEGRLRWRDAKALARQNGVIVRSALVSRIHDLIQNALPKDEAIVRAVLGMTGMPVLVDSPELLGIELAQALNVTAVAVSNDALTAHVGALAGRPGTVIAAGTGAIALGTDFAGTWTRVDGWGLRLGDEGGGGWIGTAGIRAALHAADGRGGGSPALLDALVERWGDPDTAVSAIYGSHSPTHEVAAFAPAVAAVASAGDVVAVEILAQAGRLLAGSAHAAGRSLPPTFSWAGMPFRIGDLLVEPFREELVRLRPDAVLLPPAGEAADGALTLAQRWDELGPGAVAEGIAVEVSL